MSRSNKSIYKSDEGRQAMAGWYEYFLERLAPWSPTSEWVSTRHGETHILIAGRPDAPPLWAFHGAMASAPSALAQVPGLLDRFRVHMPDTVGQPGRSDETRLNWQGSEHGWWVVDILDELELETIRAVGVSLGGYVVLRTAAVAPERIERAVLWATGGLVKPPLRDMLGLMFDGLIYAMRPRRDRLERILSRTFTDFDDDYVDFFADSLAHVHPDRRFPATLDAQELAGWQTPVMLVTHELDEVFPAEALEARARQIVPGLERVVKMPGLRHMPPFAPGALEGLMDQLEAFLVDSDEELTRRIPPGADPAGSRAEGAAPG